MMLVGCCSSCMNVGISYITSHSSKNEVSTNKEIFNTSSVHTDTKLIIVPYAVYANPTVSE